MRTENEDWRADTILELSPSDTPPEDAWTKGRIAPFRATVARGAEGAEVIAERLVHKGLLVRITGKSGHGHDAEEAAA